MFISLDFKNLGMSETLTLPASEKQPFNFALVKAGWWGHCQCPAGARTGRGLLNCTQEIHGKGLQRKAKSLPVPANLTVGSKSFLVPNVAISVALSWEGRPSNLESLCFNLSKGIGTPHLPLNPSPQPWLQPTPGASQETGGKKNPDTIDNFKDSPVMASCLSMRATARC